MAKKWMFRGVDLAASRLLAERAGTDLVVAQLLYQRGITDPNYISGFLDPKFADLREPGMLPNLAASAERIYRAVVDKTPITIYGDYDADGMCGTAILVNGLRLLGADVQYYIPNRLEDAYGLSCQSLEKLAERGRKLIISVDCGIGSVAEAERCRELGMELIVTDHHSIGERLPNASSIVHPALPSFGYPFHGLCGAGVAFKLAWGICQLASQNNKVNESQRSFLLEATCLAAVATIADVVPLLDENRILVRSALKLMLQAAPLGLAELIKQSGFGPSANLTAENIAFKIAPRINAAGRLGQAQLGVELLTTRDPERAKTLAEYLGKLNEDRDSLERSVTLAATKQLKEQFDADNDPAFVLSGSGWHLGVIGVVAGRISDKYHRPTVIIGLDPIGQKPGTGSARSQGIVDLHAVLCQCRDHLISCGGHAAAAGLKVEEKMIPAFREAFLEVISSRLNGQKPIETLHVDAEVTLKQISSLDLIHKLEKMAPFGASNPRPVLVASNVSLAEPARTMGSGARHLDVKFLQNGTRMRGVAFGQAEWVEPLNTHAGQFDIAFRPQLNEFNGMRRVELQLLDWRVAKLSPEQPHAVSSSESIVNQVR
ncbi:single-stranded-DNA-specific exonuclease RecJ [Pirellulaceae bacterium SH449]